MKEKLHIIQEPEYSIKRNKKLCVVAYCKNKSRGTLCHKHHKQNLKLTNPLSYWYQVLKQNARRREKHFGITLDEFKIFCDRTKYLKKKGRFAGCITIDRIDPEKGYILSNMQVLTNANNARKRFVDLKIKFGYYPTDEELKELLGQSIEEPIDLEPPCQIQDQNYECPF